MESLLKSKAFGVVLGIAAVSVFAVAGYFAWQSYQSAKVTPAAAPVTPLTKEEASKADLGSGLLEKAQNPIQDKLPEAVAPVPNPIQDIYKNPFQ